MRAQIGVHAAARLGSPACRFLVQAFIWSGTTSLEEFSTPVGRYMAMDPGVAKVGNSLMGESPFSGVFLLAANLDGLPDCLKRERLGTDYAGRWHRNVE
jgi:hypothetical protein